MTAYKQTQKGIEAFIKNPDCMAVAKLPIREMVTKCVPGKEYLCTDTNKSSVAKEGECLITRVYPDGTKDTYKNKKGPKYQFEPKKTSSGEDKEVTWDTLKPGESAFGKLKDGPEYDRFAMFAKPEDTVDAVWDETQVVTRPNSFVTVIYANNEFNLEGDAKWGSKQFVLNNNAGDTHPIDLLRTDRNGNPVVIGELPLTAAPLAKEKELRAYVAKYYKGKIPSHLLPVIRNIIAENDAKRNVLRTRDCVVQEHLSKSYPDMLTETETVTVGKHVLESVTRNEQYANQATFDGKKLELVYVPAEGNDAATVDWVASYEVLRQKNPEVATFIQRFMLTPMQQEALEQKVNKNAAKVKKGGRGMLAVLKGLTKAGILQTAKNKQKQSGK